MKTYELSPDKDTITCLKCHMTSHNKGDVDNLYCGNCNWMHELERPRNSQDGAEYSAKTSRKFA